MQNCTLRSQCLLAATAPMHKMTVLVVTSLLRFCRAGKFSAAELSLLCETTAPTLVRRPPSTLFAHLHAGGRRKSDPHAFRPITDRSQSPTTSDGRSVRTVCHRTFVHNAPIHCRRCKKSFRRLTGKRHFRGTFCAKGATRLPHKMHSLCTTCQREVTVMTAQQGCCTP